MNRGSAGSEQSRLIHPSQARQDVAGSQGDREMIQLNRRKQQDLRLEEEQVSLLHETKSS